MKNFAGVALPLAVAGFVASLPNLILNGGRGFAIAMLSSNSIDPFLLTVINAGSGLITYLISVAAQAYILGGMVHFSLQVCRGQRPEFGTVFAGGPYFGSMLGATILYSLGVGAGSIFCLVPGLFLAGCWVAYSAFVVDKGAGAISSLGASWQATAPYRTNALIYILLAIVVAIAGILACFIGALLVSFPVLMIANAYIYLKLIGEQPRLAT